MEFSRISRSVVGVEVVGEVVRRSREERSEGWNWSEQGTGMKTQFSGLGKTPTGELVKKKVDQKCKLIERLFLGLPDIGFYTCLFAFFHTCVECYMDSLVRGRFLRIEILDEG